MQRMTETSRMKMLMYVQAKGYGGVRLKVDGSPMGDTSGKCALGCVEMAALKVRGYFPEVVAGSEATAAMAMADTRWTPPVIYYNHPALQSLAEVGIHGQKLKADQALPDIVDLRSYSAESILALDLRREASYDPKRRPEAARELTPYRLAPKSPMCGVAPDAQYQETALAKWTKVGMAEHLKMEVPFSNTVAQELTAGKADTADAADHWALLKSFTKMEKIDLTAPVPFQVMQR